MLGQFTRKDESDGGLDLSGRDGGLLVVGSKLGSLSGNTLEDVWFGMLESGCDGPGLTWNIPLTKEFRMDMARLEIPVSG